MDNKLELYVDEEGQKIATRQTASGKVTEQDLSHLTQEQFKAVVKATIKFLDSKAKRDDWFDKPLDELLDDDEWLASQGATRH